MLKNKKHCPAIIGIYYFVDGIASPTEIGKILGVSTSSVHQILNRKFNVVEKRRMESDELLDKIEREYLDGASTYALAEKYGVRHETIGKWMKKRGHVRGKGKGVYAESLYRARQEEAYTRLVEEFGAAPWALSCSGKQNRGKRRRLRIASRNHDYGITWKSLAERNGSLTCEICGIECDPNDMELGSTGPTHPTVDHIMRICDGGEDTWENTRLACMKCNLELNAKANKARMGASA